MSSVLKPSPWYTRLLTYKISAPEHMPLLASLAHLYLEAHEAKIAELLDGPPSIITVVPSKRGVPFDSQPLKRALELSPSIKERLRQTLSHRSDQSVERWQYNPQAFSPETKLGRERIVLIEDTWVTGATALSAAGTLVGSGASVLLLPLAREVNASFWPPDHPYRQEMQKPFDLQHWPR